MKLRVEPNYVRCMTLGRNHSLGYEMPSV